MPIDIAYVTAFLRRPGIEGPQQLRGYIPCRWTRGRTRNYTGQPHPEEYTAMGASGVTIATGVDLGQRRADELLSWGLSDGVVNSLSPYIGCKQDAAIAALYRIPLVVSQETGDGIDTAVHAGYLRSYVVPIYDDGSARPFGELPRQAQAAIMSLCYQRGPGWPRKHAPNTWAAFLRGDWTDAARRLRTHSYWEGYQARRALEGALLQEIC